MRKLRDHILKIAHKAMFSENDLKFIDPRQIKKDDLMRNAIAYAWGFIFDHERSPLRHIQDLGVRHMVFQLLGWMWAIAFSLALGSYTLLAFSLAGHIILIGAAAITVATYTAATTRPKLFSARTRR